jgi:DNA polymerase-3 subunit delta
MALIHAFAFLSQPAGQLPDVVALLGSDSTLRSWAMQSLTDDSDFTSFDGAEANWSDLRDELSTASLFDLVGKRAIVLRDADEFIAEVAAKEGEKPKENPNRKHLEQYLAKPGSSARLILEFDKLPANTRIYKALSTNHLLIACGSGSDDKPGVTADARRKFLNSYVARRHQASLSREAADALVEMIGHDIGMLDTEIAKLALYLDPGGKIEEPLVREIVAGWQAKTIWQIKGAIAAGDAAEALRQLDKLISGGQRPIALFPQIAWSLRRLAMATAVVEQRERLGLPWQLGEVLSATGCKPFELADAQKQIRAIGRERGSQLLPWLLEADLRLKGTHSADGRDRFVLEQLVVKLAKSAS